MYTLVQIIWRMVKANEFRMEEKDSLCYSQSKFLQIQSLQHGLAGV